MNNTDTGLITTTGDLRFIKSELQWPPSLLDWIGVAILSILTFIANVGGLGGGGFFTPILLIQFKLSIYEAIPLVNVFGLMTPLVRFITNFKQKHPHKPWKVYLDYELIQFTMPLLYLGTLIGVEIGSDLGEIALALIFEGIVGVCTFLIAQKAINTYKQENIYRAEKLNGKQVEMQSIALIQNASESEQTHKQLSPQQEHRLREIMQMEGKHFPLIRTLQFLATFILLLFASASLKRKGNKDDGFSILPYLGLIAFMVYAALMTYYNIKQLRKLHQEKKELGYQYHTSDFKFDNNRQMIKLLLMCIFAGFLGGTVGIAGGILIIPILLKLNILPIIVSGTNQYLAMISTLSVTSQFIYMGILNFEYTAFLGIFVITSSALAIKYTNRIVELTGRQSVITFVLVFILILLILAVPLKYLIL